MQQIIPVISFECNICCIETNDIPQKYNCSVCEKKICDECFARHVLTKKTCVFCRSLLIIEDEETNAVNEDHRILLYNKHKKIIITIISFFIILYIILLNIVYYMSRDDE